MDERLQPIFSRKSVRDYTDEKISKETLELLVRAGMAAPTAKNRQPWAFIAITQKEILREIAKGLPFGKMLENVSSAVVVCGDLSKTDENDLDRWKLDCAAASENILLAAEALNLGAVWVGVYPEQSRIDHLKSVLSLPYYIIPLNIIPVGVPAKEVRPKNKFIASNLKWETWE